MNQVDYITSFKIARSCDIVFSEALTVDQFQKLKIENFSIIHKDNRQIIYKLKDFTIKSNATIFTNTYFLNDLFYLIKKVDPEYNLTLVTNQTDHLLNYDLYKRKPDCVKNWYSINLEHVNQNLIPIPLGLSNDYSPKNLLPADLNTMNSEFLDMKNKMYVNFNKNTNFSEREALYDKFENLDWVVVQNSNLSKEDYFTELSKYKFSLSPWGNGIDTHRVWESLYIGTIPITKYHHTFSTSTDLPILFVNDYSEITENLLLNYLEKFNQNKFNFKKLENSYWSGLINNHYVDIESAQTNIKSSNIISYLYIFRYKYQQFINRYIKILKFYLKKLKKIITLVNR